MSKPVMRSDGATMKWARQENSYLDGHRPIDLIETDEGAAAFAYIEGYIREGGTRTPRRKTPPSI